MSSLLIQKNPSQFIFFTDSKDIEFFYKTVPLLYD